MSSRRYSERIASRRPPPVRRRMRRLRRRLNRRYYHLVFQWDRNHDNNFIIAHAADANVCSSFAIFAAEIRHVVGHVGETISSFPAPSPSRESPLSSAVPMRPFSDSIISTRMSATPSCSTTVGPMFSPVSTIGKRALPPLYRIDSSRRGPMSRRFGPRGSGLPLFRIPGTRTKISR